MSSQGSPEDDPCRKLGNATSLRVLAFTLGLLLATIEARRRAYASSSVASACESSPPFRRYLNNVSAHR